MKLAMQLLALLLLVAASQPAMADDAVVPARSNRIAVMRGYHGYNAPILLEMLQPRGVVIDKVSGWLPLADYDNYGVVILDGWLGRANIDPPTFSEENLSRLRAFIDGGGTFIFIRFGTRAFDTEHGKAFLADLMGTAKKSKGEVRIAFDHPWLRHLNEGDKPAWARSGGGDALYYSKGISAIDMGPNRTSLYHVRSGKGQMIFVGWDIFRFRPPGRNKTTPQQEKVFNDQVRILTHIAEDLYPKMPEPMPARVFFNKPYVMPSDAVRELPPTPDVATFRSYPPTRPLPVAPDRPAAKGPVVYVDGQRGNDNADGSRDKPWKTIQHAVDQLKPGQTLYLREGTYYENVMMTHGGESGNPITIRSHPGELVTIDGGLREFFKNPASAWEPLTDGAPGEYQSTSKYPGLGSRADAVNLLARFGDSLIPMQGYRFLGDMRSDNPYFNLKKNSTDESTMYCGPGVWYNVETQRIHCRLAHTKLPGLGDDNYRGETDPRRVPIIIGHGKSALTILNARHVRVQDLVLRGSRTATLSLSVTGDVVLDGLTVYGGSTCVRVAHTTSLRVIHSAFRGVGAPWTFRSSLKYRSIEADIFSASGWQPAQNRDLELAYCEFTDSVDGVWLGNATNVRFHHNVLDNVTDDGIFLTTTADRLGNMPGGNTLIYQNRLSRSLTMFAFGVGHGRQTRTDSGVMTGKGVWIFRNVLDFRRPVYYFQPRGPNEPQELTSFGRSQGDHGGPIWEPMFIYHNTIVARQPAFRSYYGHGWGGHMRTTVRAVLNNIVVQVEKPVGTAISPSDYALMLDGNLHWSMTDGGDVTQVQYMINRIFKDQPQDIAGFPRALVYPDDAEGSGPNPLRELLDSATASDGVPFRGQHDQCADPTFVRIDADWNKANDYRLNSDSPAKGAAVAIPSAWPDPLRQTGGGDVGAIPVGHDGWRVGVRGRYHVAVHP